MTGIRICLVEDDQIMGESLVERFQLEDMAVIWLRDAAAAIEHIRNNRFDIVISDIRLPDMAGDTMYRTLLKTFGDLPPFLFITAFGTIERAVELLKIGAVDYLCKPFDIDDLLEKIHQYHRPHLTGNTVGPFDRAKSSGMVKLRSLVTRYARSSDTVLITGESGVGKEFVARHLHELDAKRAEQPFFAINCAAIPDSLAESELFGHEKGAFTGAMKQKRGAFEQAGKGTLFLDEIGDLSLSAQVKLLRVFQDRSARRVGGEEAIPFACRIVAATNRPIAVDIQNGRFREDLLYRLNALHLHIPSLRERSDEILPIAKEFLANINRRAGGDSKVLSIEAEAAIATYEWPGNIRELKNIIERAHLLADGRLIDRNHLFDESDHVESVIDTQPRLASFLIQQERAYLVEQLRAHEWRITETAAALGISRKGLWEKMRRHQITAPED